MESDPWKGSISSRKVIPNSSTQQNLGSATENDSQPPTPNPGITGQQLKNMSSQNAINTNTFSVLSNDRHIPDNRRYIYHDVKENDTLAKLAILYGIEILDLKQANNITSDADLLVKRNIRIPKAKCRINDLHLQNHQSFIDHPEDPPTMQTEEFAVKSSKTATELFAAIDINMGNAVENMKSMLEDHSANPNLRSSFSNAKKKHQYYATPSETDSLISSHQANEAFSIDPNHKRSHQSIFQFTRENGMFIDDSSTSIDANSVRNQTTCCNLRRIINSWLRWIY